MIRVRQVQNRIAQQHQKFFVFSVEESSQRLLTRLGYHAVSHPLPKLCLCGPKLFPIPANYQRRLLLALLLFGVSLSSQLIRAHLEYTSVLACPSIFVEDPEAATHSTRGEASLARQQRIVNN